MKKVKGTPVTNYVARPYHPARRRLLALVGLVLVGLMVYSAYWYGEQVGVGQETRLLLERNELRAELRDRTEQLESLRQRVAVLETASFVDKEANDGVRQLNRELSDRIAELEEEIALYQGIMSPSVNSAGLTIQEVNLTTTPSDNRYRFKVMLTQVGNNSTYLRGFVGINVLGVANGEATAFPLKDLSEDISDVDIKFRYRYFQDFTGELVLPEGFTPDQIQVVAQSVGDKAARVERAYNWSDLENGNNVGQ
ncbi:DUF6776 family protein [Reinekea blandensis]|uniref:Uncharacterized protein n=1 Tax=Reinekea blandensis MED297 TaxID=314283 RepID=A4BAH1_9GAMM|nr:DUF6776 family protein [Reinekea blandensis]EAR10927.1 hypothetical protein MED297_10466 [Reinekea sp. MED297] [Reinekea blandensis MED297]